MTNASILTHTDFKVKKVESHGAGAYCGGHLAAQLVRLGMIHERDGRTDRHTDTA